MKRRLLVIVAFILLFMTSKPSQANKEPLQLILNTATKELFLKADDEIQINKISFDKMDIDLKTLVKSEKDIESLSLKTKETLKVDAGNLIGKNYEISYTYKGEKASLKGLLQGGSNLIIKNFDQELLATIHPGDSFKLKIVLENLGKSVLDDLEIALTLPSDFTLLSGNSKLTLKQLAANENYPLEYALNSVEDSFGMKDLYLDVSYRINGLKIKEEIPFKINIVKRLAADAGLSIDQSIDSPSQDDPLIDEPSLSSGSNHGSNVALSGASDDGQQISNKPKLIVDNYSYSPNPLKAGENFKLTLSFYNTNSKKEIQNIRIVLNSSAPMSSNSDENTNIHNSQDSVFTPVDSSNTFYIDKIASKSRVTKTLTLTSPRDINPQTYELNVALDYEDKNGNEYTATEIVGIPLLQEAKLDMGLVEIPEHVDLNVPTNLSIDYYNTGKSPLYNLMVKVEGDFQIEGQAEYLGNFQPGNSENFSAVIIPEEPGPQKGTITFTYEDTTGQSHEIKKDFSFEAEEVMFEEDMEDFDPGFEAQPFYKKPSFSFSLILLALIGVTFYVIRRKKKHNNEKDLDLND